MAARLEFGEGVPRQAAELRALKAVIAGCSEVGGETPIPEQDEDDLELSDFLRAEFPFT
ncbi:MAG: hypothetical protein JNM82_05810 [Rhodocyclaceae bacterium]|nr:hypothetical protein [Rhodocyclaceae bacterium]